MFSPELGQAVLSALGRDSSLPIQSSRVSGGDINEAFCLRIGAEDYFLKINIAERFPKMFEKEAQGLALLAECSEFSIPKVLTVGESGNRQFLLMEYLGSGSRNSAFWEVFGRRLADMHKSSWESFGLEHDNYIGSLEQDNTPTPTWSSFFRDSRLKPLSSQAHRNGLLTSDDIHLFDRIYERLDTLFPKDAPALLHGDLWSGNFMCGSDGEATIYDPAVYYGHREMDLAMSMLFGGFDQRFYAAYDEAFPLEPEWQDRVDLCNLYPLLVHVLLF
ncbi:MAG: phosphotransferase, partial [Flavobacteriales bacterium]|nr:phosphotransferase [Flavobacteriales bacterium]